MMKKMLGVILMVAATSTWASLSKEEIDAVGRFIVLDFAVQGYPHRKPLTTYFWVKEKQDASPDDQVISAEDSKSYATQTRTVIPVGRYRPLILVNEISGYGALCRECYLGPDGKVYWGENTHSLAELVLRPSYGGSIGVMQLLRIYVPSVVRLLDGCQQAEIPESWHPSREERQYYRSTIGCLRTICEGR